MNLFPAGAISKIKQNEESFNPRGNKMEKPHPLSEGSKHKWQSGRSVIDTREVNTTEI